MRFHWQNLSADDAGVRRPAWHGRAWLYLRADRQGKRDIVGNPEWLLGRGHPGIEFERNDDGLHFRLGLGFATAYLSLDGVWPISGPPYTASEWSVEVHSGCVWVNLGMDPHSWSRGEPWWRRHTFHVGEWVLGKPVYKSEVIKGPVDVEIPMPERSYPATVKLTRDSWRRRFGTRVLLRCDVDIPAGVPVPGKGTQSYNCGQDAIFGMTCRAVTVAEAVSAVVDSALRTRERYGSGMSWRPEEVAS